MVATVFAAKGYFVAESPDELQRPNRHNPHGYWESETLIEANVAVLSRSCFGPRVPGETQEYVRISFAASRDQLAQGLRRIHAFMEKQA